MASIGKGLTMAIYTRSTMGATNIEFIPVGIKMASGKSLCFELVCDELKKYLERLNENIDCYEEITYAFVEDDKTTTLHPQKMMKREKQCTN